MFYGHSYFGIGKLVAVHNGSMTLDFGYPNGVKNVRESDVQPVKDPAWGLGLLH